MKLLPLLYCLGSSCTSRKKGTGTGRGGLRIMLRAQKPILQPQVFESDAHDDLGKHGCQPCILFSMRKHPPKREAPQHLPLQMTIALSPMHLSASDPHPEQLMHWVGVIRTLSFSVDMVMFSL